MYQPLQIPPGLPGKYVTGIPPPRGGGRWWGGMSAGRRRCKYSSLLPL